MAQRWFVPSLMACSLVSAILLAIGHHLFYRRLNRQIVGSVDQQQWFLRIGTGFAFLVKATLIATAGIAYTQILWRTLESCSVSLKGLDSFFGVVHNAWFFTTWELWGKGPLLALLALILWFVGR